MCSEKKSLLSATKYGSQVLHNIKMCYMVDSCPLRQPHVFQLGAVLYVGFLQIGTPQ